MLVVTGSSHVSIPTRAESAHISMLPVTGSAHVSMSVLTGKVHSVMISARVMPVAGVA